MSRSVRPLAHLAGIKPYVPGDAVAQGAWPVVKLSSNESPLGPSPTVEAAIRSEFSRIRRYPDSSARRLREELGRFHGVAPSQLIIGPGSEPLIGLVARAYATAGDEILYSRHGFAIYAIAAQTVGAIPVSASEQAYRTDVDALLARVTPRTRVVFLANPNNPTGTYVPRSEVERLRGSLPDNVLLVLDEAYAEYVDEPDYDPCQHLVGSSENTVMLRTFSKAYGLAALRVGWAYCPPAVADHLNLLRDVFSVSGPAQAAARAALADQAHLRAAVAHNTRWKGWLNDRLVELGFSVVDSVCNFVLVDLGSDQRARQLDQYLRAQGIVVRSVREYSLPHCLRMSVGLETENQQLVDACKRFPG